MLIKWMIVCLVRPLDQYKSRESKILDTKINFYRSNIDVLLQIFLFLLDCLKSQNLDILEYL